MSKTYFYISTSIGAVYHNNPNDPATGIYILEPMSGPTTFNIPLGQNISAFGFAFYDGSGPIDLDFTYIPNDPQTGSLITGLTFAYYDDSGDAYSNNTPLVYNSGALFLATADASASATKKNNFLYSQVSQAVDAFGNASSFGSQIGGIPRGIPFNNAASPISIKAGLNSFSFFTESFIIEFGSVEFIALYPNVTYTKSTLSYDNPPTLQLKLYSDIQRTVPNTVSLTPQQFLVWYILTDNVIAINVTTGTTQMLTYDLSSIFTPTTTITKTYYTGRISVPVPPTITYAFIGPTPPPGPTGGTGTVVPCFFANAEVLTSEGYKPISSLKEKDLIITQKGLKPIKKVLSYHVPASEQTNPFLIPKGKFGARKDLLISPNHCILIDGKMIPTKQLDLEKQVMEGILEYWNIELDQWYNMYVEDVEVETLAPLQFVIMSIEQFNLLVEQQCQGIPDIEKTIKEKCRFFDDKVQVPIYRREI